MLSTFHDDVSHASFSTGVLAASGVLEADSEVAFDTVRFLGVKFS